MKPPEPTYSDPELLKGKQYSRRRFKPPKPSATNFQQQLQVLLHKHAKPIR